MTRGTGPADSKEAGLSSSTPSARSGLAPASGTGNTTPDTSRAHEERIAYVRAQVAFYLLTLRKEHGWSVYDVEERTGVSRSTLSRIERQLTDPTMSVLIRVCWAYGCSASSLLARAEQHTASDPVPRPTSQDRLDASPPEGGGS
ncbi:helix-turn-helix domain-containing protein [Streptomyces sp. Tu102]|uniref:helix-turn-helix domain-containing protein n=1 Tax=Streptomyces TaxID=1883 RepID=UPI0035A92454